MRDRWPCWVGSRAEAGNHDLAVTDKWSGRTIACVTRADADAIDRAIQAAADAAR